jgi:[ribosomal protein S18]-alanine N-acetyltransferase
MVSAGNASMIFTLEPARMADAPRLAAMSRAYVEDGLRPTWPATRIVWHIRDRDSVVLKASVAGEIAGFALMRYGEDTAHLNLLAVSPRHRRRGIARQLIAWLEETALTAGTFTIALELRATNFEARGFYAAAGYRVIDCISGYYQGVEDAIRMARDVRVRPVGAVRLPQGLLDLFAGGYKGGTHRTTD